MLVYVYFGSIWYNYFSLHGINVDSIRTKEVLQIKCIVVGFLILSNSILRIFYCSYCLFVLLRFQTIGKIKVFRFCLFVLLCFWTIGKIKAFRSFVVHRRFQDFVFCLFVLLCFWTIDKIKGFRSFVVDGRFQDFVVLSVCFALFLDNW